MEKELGQQLENGDLFLFLNRQRDRLKVLFFTGDGTVLLYRHLERGTFEPLRSVAKPDSSALPYLTLCAEELRFLLEGVELSIVKHRTWWRRNVSTLIATTVCHSAVTAKKNRG